ncbi:MAG: preprotein translocase subunit YajC [Treponema sp.]|jgi:preprotein translocase subunit YajC|nr:preprotein translocase subunit YajC [Treponema sp.]MBQ2081611.1 preprotein translocase subunit YajC [Treponema sp.]MBR6296723.1 preprotein translocase subunit YajC [Treponema sp.]MEE3312598.1 preprotein translocase subunit YajC [Treponema sp.]
MHIIPMFLQDAASVPMGGMGGSGLITFVPLLLLLVIMYFFMIRPQNKKQKETEKMIAALKKGDKVITVGGIHGTIASTKEKTVIVKVEDGSRIEFNRTAIATVVVEKSSESEKIEEKKGLFGKKTDKIVAEIKDKDAEPAENAESESGTTKDE